MTLPSMEDIRQATVERLAKNAESIAWHVEMWQDFHDWHGPFKRTSRVQRDHNALMRELARVDRVGRSDLKYIDELRQRARVNPPNRCGATTRKGTPCQAKCVPGKAKCRMHGGLSSGPKTAAGRAAITESNRRRAQLRRQLTQVDTETKNADRVN